jgi:dTDP-glucose 4,6-dehydratase
MHIDDGRAVANFIQQALRGEPLTVYGDGLQTRSFCYVDDLIDGIYRLLMSEEHYPVNIGNPAEITIKQFAEEIDALVGNQAGLVFEERQRGSGDPQRRQPDISRAKEVLDNWGPTISLTDGLAKTVAYFKDELGM